MLADGSTDGHRSRDRRWSRRRPRVTRIGGRRLLAIMLALATISTLLAAPVGANPGDLQTDCSAAPSTIPSGDLMRGMTGTGYTAIQGAEPVAFDVEILGVLPNAIGLGLDMILARASGAVIDQVGGVAAGMSGSPIYIHGDLVGALAYGLAGSDDVFGITPAAAMTSILDYPATTAPASTPMSMSIDGAMVEMSGRQRVSALPLPMAVSGINPGRLSLLNARSGIQADVVVPSGNNDGGGSGGGSMGSALPGEPLSVVLSQGDVSFFATGTATLCRDNQTIAFGHPATFRGKTSMGMATADIITIIDDESGLFGNYKIATLGEIVGRVDRDHLAGIRGINGELPSFIPISSTVTFDELSRSRMGHTKALEERFLPDIAFTHIFANIDSVFDAVGEGSSEIVFTIEGLRADGSPFSVDRTNLYSSMFDISFESAFELPTYLNLLLFNPYEDVSISGIDIQSLDLVSEAREWSITDATVTTDEGTVTDGLISVQPGEEITIDVTLSGGGTEASETLTLSIPQDIGFGFGSLVIMGAGDGGGFFEEPPPPDEQSSGEPGSFDELLEDLSTRPANSDIVARLEMFSEAGPVQGGPSVVTSTVTTDRVVRGSQFFDVTTFGDPGFPEGINVPLTGEGFGNAYLEIGESNIFFDVFAETETPVTAIHIHRGFEGEDGPIVVDFDYPNLGSTGNVAADPEVLSEITANPAGFYVNVHTEAFPNGAIRGQISDAGPPVEPPAEGNPGGYVDAGGQWFIPGLAPFWFGVPGDIPFLGDWNGDGQTTPGLYRPSTGYAYIRNSNDTGMADVEWYMGIPGDAPLVGDWDGDGIDTFGVFRSGEAKVYLRNALSTGFADIEFHYGQPGDLVFAGDFDGDGIDDIGAYRDGHAYIRFELTSGMADLDFSMEADDIVVGDWNDDGIDDLGAIVDGVLMFVTEAGSSPIGPAEGLIRKS